MRHAVETRQDRPRRADTTIQASDPEDARRDDESHRLFVVDPRQRRRIERQRPETRAPAGGARRAAPRRRRPRARWRTTPRMRLSAASFALPARCVRCSERRRAHRAWFPASTRVTSTTTDRHHEQHQRHRIEDVVLGGTRTRLLHVHHDLRGDRRRRGEEEVTREAARAADDHLDGHGLAGRAGEAEERGDQQAAPAVRDRDAERRLPGRCPERRARVAEARGGRARARRATAAARWARSSRPSRERRRSESFARDGRVLALQARGPASRDAARGTRAPASRRPRSEPPRRSPGRGGSPCAPSSDANSVSQTAARTAGAAPIADRRRARS